MSINTNGAKTVHILQNALFSHKDISDIEYFVKCTH